MYRSSNQLFLILVFISIVSCSVDKESPKSRPPVQVEAIIAGYEDFPKKIEVNGSAVSNEMVELFPETGGLLVYLNMPDGAFVKKGTILARINDAELQAELVMQTAQLELANSNENRLKKLLDINGVNQADYDLALSQVNTLRASIGILNARIDKTIVRAPFDGTLGLRMISPGAYVSPQTLLGTLHQEDMIKIDFSVPETYKNLVSKGMTVTIITNDTRDIYQAEITAIEPGINSDTRNLKARAILKEGMIKPGSFVKVIISQTDKRITVPTSAILPNASSSQVILFKSGKGVFTNVETGVRNEEVVEILKGLNPGDTVITAGSLFVRANSVLQINKIVTKENHRAEP